MVSPHPPSQIFAMFYVILGITLLGYFLSVFIEYILTRQADMFMDILEDVEEEQGLIGNALVEDALTPAGAVDCGEISPTVVAVALLVILSVGGTLFYARVHDPPLSLVDAAYFTIVTITTVGYGDVVPDTDGGKIFSIFFLPIASVLLARVAGDIVLTATAKKRAEILDRTRNALKQNWKKADLNNDGKVGESEFIIHRLSLKVTPEELEAVRAEFEDLDRDGSDYITVGEL